MARRIVVKKTTTGNYAWRYANEPGNWFHTQSVTPTGARYQANQFNRRMDAALSRSVRDYQATDVTLEG